MDLARLSPRDALKASIIPPTNGDAAHQTIAVDCSDPLSAMRVHASQDHEDCGQWLYARIGYLGGACSHARN